MYTEGFEGLEEAEREPRRTYVSGSQDADRLQREIERLKKSLEKEKFFNKLLDQEIQELKSSDPNSRQNFTSDYWYGNKRVSRGAFYTLLVITLLMAAYIGYGLYYDKQFNYLTHGRSAPLKPVDNPTSAVIPPAATDNSVPNNNDQPKNTTDNKPLNDEVTPAPAEKEKINTPVTSTPESVAKDSVPNIIGSKKSTVAEKKKETPAVKSPDEEYNEEEVNAVLREPVSRVPAPVTVRTPVENRSVIARYRIPSKANFYNEPDENTMRSTFIPGNKSVGALEEKNGFIYVVYTNDLGFTARGWLSKKDLTKE